MASATTETTQPATDISEKMEQLTQAILDNTNATASTISVRAAGEGGDVHTQINTGGDESDEDKKDAAAKKAAAKKAAQKKAAAAKKAAQKKAMDEDDDDDEKDAGDEKDAEFHDGEKKDATAKKIANLTAAVEKLAGQQKVIMDHIGSVADNQTMISAKPMVDAMLTARADAGATQEQLDAFSRSMYGLKYDEIKNRYDDDMLLIASSSKGGVYGMQPPAAQPSAPSSLLTAASLPEFGSSASAPASGTLEEIIG